MELGTSFYHLIKRKYDLTLAHYYSDRNKEMLSTANKCGCFYCTEIFSPSEIEEWVKADIKDEIGRCAVCPYCGIDSVIPGNIEYPLSKSFLKAMKKRWFG